jgi:hypothetical protein
MQSYPAGQSRHIAKFVGEYYPEPQGKTGDESVRSKQAEPGAQGEHAVCPATEYVPVAHITGSAFVAAQKNPAGHDWHDVIPLREYEPAEHTVGDTVLSGHIDPAGHSVHAAEFAGA